SIATTLTAIVIRFVIIHLLLVDLECCTRPLRPVSIAGEGKTCASRPDVRCGLVPQEVGENTRHGKGLTLLRHKVTGEGLPEGAGRGIPGQPSPATLVAGATNVAPSQNSKRSQGQTSLQWELKPTVPPSQCGRQCLPGSPAHRIISSACKRSVGEMVRPRAMA